MDRTGNFHLFSLYLYLKLVLSSLSKLLLNFSFLKTFILIICFKYTINIMPPTLTKHYFPQLLYYQSFSFHYHGLLIITNALHIDTPDCAMFASLSRSNILVFIFYFVDDYLLFIYKLQNLFHFVWFGEEMLISQFPNANNFFVDTILK